jgi:hypothetical protein
MQRPCWHWIGTLDLFGLSNSQVEEYFNTWLSDAALTDSDLQIVKQADVLDSLRYQVHLRWSYDAPCIIDYLSVLATMIPQDHPVMTLQGYGDDFQRQDIILRKQKVYLRTYRLEPNEEEEYSSSSNESVESLLQAF